MAQQGQPLEQKMLQPSTTASEDPNDFREANLPPWKFWVLSIGLGSALFLAFLDTSIVATSLFIIGREFSAFENINWVALAYTLSYLGCAVPFTRLADIVGRRAAFMAAYIIFIGFSIGCGFAQTITQLIALRALQGVGGSGLYSLTMVIWPELASDSQKQSIAGMVGLVSGSAGVLGPVLGGLLTSKASWRWIFWINGPIGLASVAVFLLAWPSRDQLPSLHRNPWKSFDVVGALLLIAASVLVTFSFQNASEDPDSWSHAMFIGPIVAGCVCWIMLFGWEWCLGRFWANSILPTFPLTLFRNRAYLATTLVTLLMGFPFFMTSYAFALRTQVVNGRDALIAGLALLPMLGGVALGTITSGAVNGRKNLLFETGVLACAFMLLGCGLETTLTGSLEIESKSLGFLFFVGYGFGCSATSSTMLTAVEAPISDHAPAQGIMAQARILGGSLGIAASSAILAVQTKYQLASIVRPDQVTSVSGGAGGPSLLTPTQQAAIRRAFADAFTQDMRVSAAVAGVALVLSLGVFRRGRLGTIAEMRIKQIEDENARRRAGTKSLPRDRDSETATAG